MRQQKHHTNRKQQRFLWLQGEESVQHSRGGGEKKGHVKGQKNIYWYSSGRDFKHHWTSIFINLAQPSTGNKLDLDTALGMSKGREAGISGLYNLPCLRQIETILSHMYQNTLVTCPKFLLLLQRVSVKCSSKVSLYRSLYRGWKIASAPKRQISISTVDWVHLK